MHKCLSNPQVQAFSHVFVSTTLRIYTHSHFLKNLALSPQSLTSFPYHHRIRHFISTSAPSPSLTTSPQHRPHASSPHTTQRAEYPRGGRGGYRGRGVCNGREKEGLMDISKNLFACSFCCCCCWWWWSGLFKYMNKSDKIQNVSMVRHLHYYMKGRCVRLYPLSALKLLTFCLILLLFTLITCPLVTLLLWLLISHFSNRISEVDTIKSKVNGLRRVIDTFNENFIQIYFPFFFPWSFFLRCFMHFNVVSMKVQLFVDITNCYYAHKSCCSDKFSCC